MVYDVTVIGGGPAGMAAALSAESNDCSVVLVERECELGGILKQCIHDGFGTQIFNERLTGPEYAEKYMRKVYDSKITLKLLTFVISVEKKNETFVLTLMNSMEGVFEIESKILILANGCRERTSKQIFINGSRPAGVYSAGTAQCLINISGLLPCKKCVILGSGDIGLIMARRLTLEGADVVGVYEVKSTPSGLSRNIAQCLEDYRIPLHLGHTITRIIGEDRVEAVEICEVDSGFKPIKDTEEIIECDGVILSVGLIPENEIAESLEVEIDKKTRGPVVDDSLMTSMEGVFSCGNALHVNDLVDYVSLSGEKAGDSAARFLRKENLKKKNLVNLTYDDSFLYALPQKIRVDDTEDMIIYFRSKEELYNCVVKVISQGNEIFKKKYKTLKPPEMEEIKIVKRGIKSDIKILLEKGDVGE